MNLINHRKATYCECCGKVIFNRSKQAKYCLECAEHNRLTYIDKNSIIKHQKGMIERRNKTINKIFIERIEKKNKIIKNLRFKIITRNKKIKKLEDKLNKCKKQ